MNITLKQKHVQTSYHKLTIHVLYKTQISVKKYTALS